jgi:hypothetical protein
MPVHDVDGFADGAKRLDVRKVLARVDKGREMDRMSLGETANLVKGPDLVPLVRRIRDPMAEIEQVQRSALARVDGDRTAGAFLG